MILNGSEEAHHELVVVILVESISEKVVDDFISEKLIVYEVSVIDRPVNGEGGIVRVPTTGKIECIVWQLSLPLFE